MNKDYKNFVERMGSFENELSIVNEIKHYGILGMRWGRRRGPSSSNSKPEAKAIIKQPSDDYVKTRELRKKRSYELTNTELKALNTRLQLEKTYSELNPSTVSKGKKLANELLLGAAKQSASKYLNKGIEIAVKSAINMK